MAAAEDFVMIGCFVNDTVAAEDFAMIGCLELDTAPVAEDSEMLDN